MKLKQGIYEQVISNKIHEEIKNRENEINIQKEEIEKEEAKIILSKYLQEVTKKSLNLIKNKDLDKQIQLCNQIINYLSEQVEDEEIKEKKIKKNKKKKEIKKREKKKNIKKKEKEKEETKIILSKYLQEVTKKSLNLIKNKDLDKQIQLCNQIINYLSEQVEDEEIKEN